MKTSTIVLLFAALVASASARSAASECPPMYYKIGNVCGSCGANQATCTASADNVITPGECTTGNIVSADGKSCVTGTDPTINLSCAEALCLSQGAAGCPVCNDGYYPLAAANSTVGYCQSCPGEGTAKCSDATTITACRTGYFLTEGDSATCQACGTGCAACTTADACDTCMEVGYYTDSSNACVACAEGCATCSVDGCTVCSAQYVLGTDSVCVSKPGCEEGSEGKCTTCMDKYRLVSTDGSCKACSSKVLTCDSSADGTSEIINTCKSNYIKKGTGSTAECVQVNTASIPCVEVDADGKCSKCVGAGWVLDTGACKACSLVATGCGACTAGDATTAATCSACAVGYHGDGTNCATCVANCAECADGTTCSVCNQGYYINDNNVCAACNAGLSADVTFDMVAGAVFGATDCTLNQANSCAVGFGLQTVPVCRACMPSINCAACANRWDQCTACTAPRVLHASSNTCVTCDPQCAGSCTTEGQDKCDFNTNAATSCNQNVQAEPCGATVSYTWRGDTKTCIVDTEKPTGCTTADTADGAKCATCTAGYADANGVCQSCPTNCTTCTSATACTGCVAGKTGAVCADNCDASCVTCTGTAATNCASCAAGKGLKADNTCVTCDASCVTCNDTTATACLTCAAGKGLKADNSCVTCDASCLTCNDTTATACLTCATGKGLKADNSCVTCHADCLTCDDTTNTACLTCRTGYTHNAGAKTCTYTCCTTNGEFVSTTNNSCGSCSANCNVCTSATACTTCAGSQNNGAQNYQLTATNTCVDIVALNCATHVANDADKCTTCATNYFKDANNLCVACSAGCSVCTDATTCTTCGVVTAAGVGYFKNADNGCTSCIVGCGACADATTCTTCASGFVKKTSDNTCVACPENCTTCTIDANDAVTCTACGAGYVVATMPTGSTETTFCEVCDATCMECTFTAAGKRSCTKCNAELNHHLSAEGGDKCHNKSCAKSNGVGCTECPYGLKLVDQYTGCTDCIGDASCPVSTCGSATPGTTPGGAGNGSSAATDSSASRYAANILILAFLALLGLSLF